ncbi:Aspartate/glutamate/uridylate kinase [Penicillium expansum]|nr:Aspartate/glutamate/uridylate kinase [Penicillium expansum]
MATTISDSNLPVTAQAHSNWVVQKFGGTSVGKFARNIIEQVVQPSLVKNRVAVVCSARSSSTKAEGTTNRLLRAARDAEHPRSQQYLTLVEAVRLEHVQVAQEELQSAEIRDQVIADITGECERVLRFLEAAQTLGEISARCVDKVMSAGEKLSCLLMAALLQDRGVDSQYVDLSEIIDFPIGPQGLDQDFYNALAAAFGSKVEACGHRVPVMTGYFGTIPGGLLDQIGRGYTDLCAALVAVGTRAEELQVWKEVDGIFTADPLIHPFTMEQVIRARIPIRIKNVMNPKNEGTIIFPDSVAELERTTPGHDPRLFRTRSPSLANTPKRPTAVTIKHNILVINVHSNKRSLSHGFFAGIFSVLDKWRLSIDLISTSEVHVSLALHSEMPLLNGNGRDEYQVIDDDLQGALNDLGRRMFTTLGENSVNIEMISQGASEINISCVIEERDADRALNIIHTSMFTFLD